MVNPEDLSEAILAEHFEFQIYTLQKIKKRASELEKLITDEHANAGNCPHPKQHLVNQTTLGSDKICYLCTKCGTEFVLPRGW